MAANPVDLMTVEQFRNLAEREGEFYYELHHGQVVKMTRPKKLHFSIQRRLRKLLEAVAPEESLVDSEVAFRPLPEYELWVADVAVVNGNRWNAVSADDNLRGAPDLVIEVLSPSNSVAEMLRKQELCLANGCLEFWLVDPKRQTVQVISLGKAATYTTGQQIPLPVLRVGASIPVDQIFV